MRFTFTVSLKLLLAALFLLFLPGQGVAAKKKELPTFYLNRLGVIGSFHVSAPVMSKGCAPLVVAEKEILLGRFTGQGKEGVTQIDGKSLALIKKTCPFALGERLFLRGILLKNDKVMALEIRTTQK